MSDQAAQSLAAIRGRAPDAAPEVGLVLGSGLRALAERLDGVLAVPYAELPGFPRPSVEGHGGDLVLGRLGGRPVAVLTGRCHTYETGRADGMSVPLRVLHELGCRVLVLTNAAASLRSEVGPGSLMLVTDHINFSGTNPLIGRTEEPRFVDLTEAYDADLRRRALAAAAAEGIVLHQGVYMWVAGPSFETPAEVRAARVLGADAVGMSTVPEAILARQLGLRVLALSAVTNLGAGLETQTLDHGHTLATAAGVVEPLGRLLATVLRDLDR